MKITENDIDVFILTFNRSFYLAQAIESVLNQTLLVKSITVLDNCSTDDTEEVVNKYKNRGVKYIKTFGYLANFNKAHEISSKKYTMLFHDDDLLNHKYIEYALKAINDNPDTSLVTANNRLFQDGKYINTNCSVSYKYSIFKHQYEFSEFVYFCGGIAYSPAIYKTEHFKKESAEYEKFSKHFDYPLLVNMAKYGSVILLEDKNIFYARVHKLQDSESTLNRVSIDCIVNWDVFFYNTMKIDNKLEKAFQLKSSISILDKYQFNYNNSKKLQTIPNELINVANKNKIKLSIINKKDSKSLDILYANIRYKYLNKTNSNKLLLKYFCYIKIITFNNIFHIYLKQGRLYYRLLFVHGYIRVKSDK